MGKKGKFKIDASIPAEIWCLILGYLGDSAKDLVNASITCKRFNIFIKSDKELKKKLASCKPYLLPIKNNIIRIALAGWDEEDKYKLLNRLFPGPRDDFDPTITNIIPKALEVDGEKYTIEVVYLLCPDEGRKFDSSYYKSCHGVYGIYSIESAYSLQYLDRCLQGAQTAKNSKFFPIIVVGNTENNLLRRYVTLEEGHNFAKKYNALYTETHPQSNVDEVLIMLVRDVIEVAKGNLCLTQPRARYTKKQKNRCSVM